MAQTTFEEENARQCVCLCEKGCKRGELRATCSRGILDSRHRSSGGMKYGSDYDV